MSGLRQRLKRALFGLMGKDPEAVVVCFLTGGDPLAGEMAEEVRSLVPGRRHFAVGLRCPEKLPAGVEFIPADRVRPALRRYRIGLAPVLFTSEREYDGLRRTAMRLAPFHILAYNARLERHHLRLSCWISSLLFLRGVPLDRIHLRPRWLCPWRGDRTIRPSTRRILDGRPLEPSRRRIGVLAPYFPYPLSHGGAVRIYYLLRELAREFDVFLFAFAEHDRPEDTAPVLEYCARAVLLPAPRYREPRWSTWLPPEADEFRAPLMARLIEEHRREFGLEALQVEYTSLATYGGDVLVEHDVTFDLYEQVWRRERTPGAWWNLFRWRRFERAAVQRYRRVIAMSDKDAALLATPNARVIGNGVDLDRFRPEPETPGRRLLFVGSFRHFPNVVAFRFLAEEVWPLLRERDPGISLTVVGGPGAETHWRGHTGKRDLPEAEGLTVLGFVRDVRPLYVEANLVVVPTLVSAGTNLKVLEAMAMERAVVSTSSGCAGLGLEHGASVWVADAAEPFATGVLRLLCDEDLRSRIAAEAREHAVRNFGWESLGSKQRAVIREVLPELFRIRAGRAQDLPAIAAIQAESPEAAHWEPSHYLDYGLLVAEHGRETAGFLVWRRVSEDEGEVLNVAVSGRYRRRGAATALLGRVREQVRGDVFLEVRESNLPARRLYVKLGFLETGRRPGYYDDPPEAAIVMRVRS